MKLYLYLSLILLMYSCSTSKNAAISPVVKSNFSTEELKLINQQSSTSPMRVYLITNKQDSILLRKKCRNVLPNIDNDVLKNFTDRLLATVTDSMSMGVGIAAPQVGVLANIIWVQRLDKEGFPFEVYLNPVIKQYSKKKQPCPEGCLSIPNVRQTTQNRAYAILLEYDTLSGNHIVEMVEDFTAVIFQHEIDHLNGILFIDHLKQEIEDATIK